MQRLTILLRDSDPTEDSAEQHAHWPLSMRTEVCVCVGPLPAEICGLLPPPAGHLAAEHLLISDHINNI